MSLLRSRSLLDFSSIFCTRVFQINGKQLNGSHVLLARCLTHCDPIISAQNRALCKLQCGPLTILSRSPGKRFVSTSLTRSSPLVQFASNDEPGPEKLIYNGPLSGMVRLVKFFSLFTSIASSGLLALLVMSGGGGALTVVAGGMATIMIVTPIFLHWFIKGYITRLYYDSRTKTYTACTYSFFLADVTSEFMRTDVSLPRVSSVMSSIVIRGKPVLIDPRGFSNPNHYSHLMGYTDTDGNVTAEEAKRAFETVSRDPEAKS